MDSDLILVCRDLEKRLGSRPVLSHLNLIMRRGGALAVTGANGAGKSTLLRVVVGAWGRSGGVMERFGQSVEMSGTSDPRIGYVGHQSLLYPSLTLNENLTLYGRLAQVPDLYRRIHAAVSRLQLSWCEHDMVGFYSRGMLQRATLARLLVSDAQFWVLDEPFAGLDTLGRNIFTTILQEVKDRGHTILLTTHQPHEAAAIVDLVAVLDGGRFTRWSDVQGTQVSVAGVKF